MLKCSDSNSILSNLSLDSIEEEETEPWHGLIQKLSVFHLESLCAVFKVKKYKSVTCKDNITEGLTKEEFLKAIEEILDSIEEEETEPWPGLIHKLSVFHLEPLCAVFKERKYKSAICNENITEGVTKEQFLKAVEEILGNCKYSLQASILYTKIDVENNLRITWDQFLNFLIENSAYDFKASLRLHLSNIFNPPHVKKDTISKIVLIETDKYFCYAILSKYGHIGLYDGNMNFLTSYQMIMTREDISRKEKERRRRNRWITDAVFVKDVLMLFITTTTRSITVYDASGLTHTPLWLILGIPNIIQQLYAEKEFVVIKSIGHIHSESLNSVYFCKDNNTIVTSSRDSTTSLIIKALDNRKVNYYFKIYRGASCFAISRHLKVLITGSDNGIIRIWNIVVKSKPTAILKDHQSGIIDIQIIESEDVFLSCSKDGVFKLWSIKEQKCMQTIKLKFPSFQILGKTVEWGINSIYPGPKRYLLNENAENDLVLDTTWLRSHLFVACCNHIAQINITFTDSNKIFDSSVIPAPPLQNTVLLPSTWRICADAVDVPRETGNSIPAIEDKIDQEYLAKKIESFKFILDKNILLENNLKSNINFRLACLEQTKLKMLPIVSKCAPYLALDLPLIEEIKLSSNLPIPTNKETRKLVERTQNMLSGVASKTRAYLERSSSSRTQSSRSSIITFE